MKTNKRYGTAVLGSLLAATILSGVAVAGNPHGSPPGQAKADVHGSASVTVSASPGVKPSSTTNVQHNTTAPAGSTKTKLYGNGKTAGEIAMQNGAGADTQLTGPGNSQPHKVVPCPGGKHAVDVHALKAHRAGSCPAASTASTSTSTSTSVSGSVSASTHVSGVGASAHAGVHGKAKGAFTPPSSTTSGGVLGASVSGRARPARPVVGAANFTG